MSMFSKIKDWQIHVILHLGGNSLLCQATHQRTTHLVLQTTDGRPLETQLESFLPSFLENQALILAGSGSRNLFPDLGASSVLPSLSACRAETLDKADNGSIPLTKI